MSVALRYQNKNQQAASAVNMAFLKILNHLSRFKENASFKGWIRQILINTVIDEYRKTSRYRELQNQVDYEKELSLNGIHADYNQAENNLNVEQLVRFIHQLNPLTANVFNLFVLDGYSHKDISELLQISEAASKWHLFTARKQLQEMVENASLNNNANLMPTIKFNRV